MFACLLAVTALTLTPTLTLYSRLMEARLDGPVKS